MPTVRAMITHLEELYGEQSHTAHFEVSKRLFNLKIHEGQSVYEHYITVIKDIEELGKLGHDMQKELQMNLILQFLTSSYSQFIINFHMNKLNCTIPELVNMLVTTEEILKSLRGTILAVERTSSKRKSIWKKKARSAKKQKKENRPKKKVSSKAEVKKKYFHCHAEGH